MGIVLGSCVPDEPDASSALGTRTMARPASGASRATRGTRASRTSRAGRARRRLRSVDAGDPEGLFAGEVLDDNEPDDGEERDDDEDEDEEGEVDDDDDDDDEYDVDEEADVDPALYAAGGARRLLYGKALAFRLPLAPPSVSAG